ncbi:MAG: division/cell wall cluster transcriptional repressor MraZ, partial [Wujia sp.]
DFYEGSAVVCEMDSQYRIVIPQKLREYAGIDREVVMIGHTDTVAIWDKAAWDKINSPEEIDLKEIAEIGELFNI